MTDIHYDAEATMRAVAASIALDVPDACVPGVVANMALLADQAAALEAFELPDDPSA